MFVKQFKKNKIYSCFTRSGWNDFTGYFGKNAADLYPVHGFEKNGNYYLDVESIRQNRDICNIEMWQAILKHRVVKPRDCLFAFGIPTDPSIGSLFRQEYDKIKSDYLKNAGAPELYKRKVLDPVRDFIIFLKKLHVAVREDVTIEVFKTFFKTDYLVVFLFTHFIEKDNQTYDTKGREGVELGMQFVSLDELVAAVPGKDGHKEYQNILDLCICDADPLGVRMRWNRPNCNIRYLKKKANPSEWLAIYKCLFTLFHHNELSYHDANLELTRYLANCSRGVKK